MRTLFIFLLIFTFLFSCKTTAPVSIPEIKIQTKEVDRYSFVLETEKDFARIDKNYIVYIKMHHSFEEKYILFKRENSSYIQKVVDKAMYYPVKLKSHKILNLFITLYPKIKNERVKYFTNMDNQRLFVTHSTILKYILVCEQDKSIAISFSEYDFEKDNHGDKNASYDYNKRLKLFKIDSLLNSEIDELNGQNAFKFRKYLKD